MTSQTMQCDILTLFPDMVEAVLSASILERAREKGLLDVRAVNLRDYAEGRHKGADDYPYGGGAGMVIKPEPVFHAVEDLRGRHGDGRLGWSTPTTPARPCSGGWQCRKSFGPETIGPSGRGGGPRPC